MSAKQTVVVAALAGALAISGAACGSTGGSSAKAARSTTIVPKPLAAIEAAAEDIIDIAPRERWSSIRRDARDIDAAWSSYKDRAVADGARPNLTTSFTQALTVLQATAAKEDGSRIAQAANDVSAATVELFALYHPRTPVDIGRLDVVGRQMILDVQRHDLGAARTQVQKVASIWTGGLRDDVLAHRGPTVATRTDAALAAMEQAAASGDGATLVTRANAFLELVDAMEKLF